jgi:LysM domain
MVQQFTTAKHLLAAVAAAAMLALPAVTEAQNPQNLQIVDKAPSSYTVQKGDTLWGISGRYLKDPWRWPDIWRLNKDQIKNPHLIYPGDIVRLDYVEGQPQLSLTRNGVRVSPSTRASALDVDVIPSIPPGDIEPYLSKNLVTGPNGLANAAEILSGRNQARMVRGAGDVVYVAGLDSKAGDYYYIYRAGGPINTWDGQDVLGYQSKFIGTARVEKWGELSTVRIESADLEVVIGDRLLPAPREILANYIPRAPDKDIYARILEVPFSNTETGRGYVVTLDKGRLDGLEPGNVLAVYRAVEPIVDTRASKQQSIILRFLEPTTVFTPAVLVSPADERTGLMFVFRTFDRVSYAVVLNTSEPVRPGDYARTP